MNIKNNIPNWKQLLNLVGNKGIVQNIPFILYCAFLALIYITVNHFAENTIRDINKTGKMVKELRWKYVDEKTQIMYATKESELEKSVARIDLEKTRIPPHKIIVQKPTINED
jgi:preprotein translocase subunit Sec63